MGKKVVLAVILVVLLVGGYTMLTRKKPAPPPPAPVPVLAGKAVQKTMPLVVEAIGTVEASNSVTVYSRVMGQLVKTHFREGQDVKRGDLLFTIDPATYKEKLRNAEAKLAQDMAQLAYYEAEAKRYAYLLEKGAVSRSDYESKQTQMATQDALVKADRAEVESARLNVEYCYIRSPIDGRTGLYGVHEGTMVKENDTRLAVINRLMPVYVKFSVPERRLAEIRKHMAGGSLKVKATPQGEQDRVAEGTLTFIDNAVDAATGQITLRAAFENREQVLWPGQYVTVALRLAEESGVTVVPVQAVQLSQSGPYVFVVDPENKARHRPVTVARTVGAETVIAKGVKPGETVVTDGQLKLRDGFRVEVRDALSSTQGNGAVKGGNEKAPDTKK